MRFCPSPIPVTQPVSTIGDLAAKAQLSVEDTEHYVAQMEDLGMVQWLLEGDTEVLHICNWDKRQFKTDTDGAERVRRHRERKKQAECNSNVTTDTVQRYSNVTVTPPETDTDTETDTEEESRELPPTAPEDPPKGAKEPKDEQDPPPPASVADVIEQHGGRYTPEQRELIADYWDIIRFTRKLARVAPSVVARELEYWERFAPDLVEEALEKHLEHHETKREGYTRGIMRGLEDDRRLGKTRNRAPPKKPVDDVAESWEGVRPDAERDPRKYHP